MKKQKILVIDDERDTRESIITILSNDYKHIEVDAGLGDLIKEGDTESLHDELKKIFKKNCAELRAIICDLNLTGQINQFESGVDLITWVRTDCNIFPNEVNDIFFKAIPIIVCTKKDFTVCDPQEYYKVIKAGADDIITKSEGDDKSFANDLINSLKPRLKRFGDICKELSFYKYKIGISYTWKSKSEQHHEFVDEIARLLSAHYSEGKILYDEAKQESGESVGLNPEQFSSKYKNDCEFILVCLSEDYNQKNNSWTKTEWVNIKTVYDEDHERVFFLPIEDLNLKSVYNNLGIQDNSKQTITIKNVHQIRSNYYNVISGKSDKQKNNWSKILEGNKKMEEYVKESFDERNKIIKESITAGIIKVILGKIKAKG